MSPLSQYWKKRGKHLQLYALFKNTFNAQILKKKFTDMV